MKNKKKVVFDTSTIISGLFFKNSKPYKALKKAENEEYIILTSEYSVSELSTVSARNKFDRYFSLPERKKLVSDFLAITEYINSVDSVENDCRDPKDVPFLELAHTEKADYIVSSDSDLLDLNPFKEIHILTASKFLELDG